MLCMHAENVSCSSFAVYACHFIINKTPMVHGLAADNNNKVYMGNTETMILQS